MGVICRDEEIIGRDDVREFLRGAVIRGVKRYRDGKFKGRTSTDQLGTMLDDAEIVTKIPIITHGVVTWIVRMYTGHICSEIQIKRICSNGVGAPRRSSSLI